MDKKTLKLTSDDRVNFIRSLFENRMDFVIKNETLIRIQEHWNVIADKLSVNAVPVKYKNKVLTVRVEKSVYAQELNLYSNWILDRLKDLAIPVESIKIETGALERKKASTGTLKEKDLDWNSDNKRKLSPAQKEFLEGLQQNK